MDSGISAIDFEGFPPPLAPSPRRPVAVHYYPRSVKETKESEVAQPRDIGQLFSTSIYRVSYAYAKLCKMASGRWKEKTDVCVYTYIHL